MNAPEPRHASGRRISPKLLLLAAFLLGVLASAAVAVGLVALSTGPDVGTTQPPAAGGPEASPSGARGASGGSGSAAGSRRDENVRRGLMIEPLAALQPGDRVVYNMRTCRFRGWVGEGLDVALISCPGEPRPFQTRTAFLVPVEPATAD